MFTKLIIIAAIIATIWGYLRFKKLKDDANQIVIGIDGVDKPNINILNILTSFDLWVTLGIQNNSTQSVTINDLHGTISLNSSQIGSFAYPTDIQIAANGHNQQRIKVTVDPISLGSDIVTLIKNWSGITITIDGYFRVWLVKVPFSAQNKVV